MGRSQPVRTMTPDSISGLGFPYCAPGSTRRTRNRDGLRESHKLCVVEPPWVGKGVQPRRICAIPARRQPRRAGMSPLLSAWRSGVTKGSRIPRYVSDPCGTRWTPLGARRIQHGIFGTRRTVTSIVVSVAASSSSRPVGAEAKANHAASGRSAGSHGAPRYSPGQ